MKLCTAKNEYIARTIPSPLDTDSEDAVGSLTDSGSTSEDSESISLNQIAQQYSEIENILKTVTDALVSLVSFSFLI